jgi:hypothetical protein
MSCYLCAYQRAEKPEHGDTLPGGSEHVDAVGTCSICWVWACALHGTRYSQFECAICTPAAAVLGAITAPAEAAASSAAVAMVRSVDRNIPSSTTARMGEALERIRHDQERAEEPREPSEARAENIMTDLAGVLRERADVRSIVPARTGDDERPPLSLDGISASVRARFAGLHIAEPSPEVSRLVASALLAGQQIADARGTPTRHWLKNAAELPPEVVPPWQTRNPALLDPVLWLVGSAYHLAS